jgi:hypothetical protein
MADTNLTLSGPMEFDSRSRVAWDMARVIAGREKNSEVESKPRAYYLKLVYECDQVLRGYEPNP